MNTVKCTKCGKVNKLKLDASSLSSSVTLRCGVCNHPLLSLEVDQRRPDWRAYWKKAVTIFHYVKKRPRIFFTSCTVVIGLVLWSGASNNNASNSTAWKLPLKSTAQKKEAADKAAFYSYSIAQRKMIQTVFKNNFGYSGKIDGLWGPATKSAYYRGRKAEASSIAGLSHSQIFANIINFQQNRQNAAGQFVNNLLGAYIAGKSLGGNWVNPQTGQTVYPELGWRPKKTGNELGGYSCYNSVNPHLKSSRQTSRGMLCTYYDGTTINIGVGICPLTCN